MAEPLVQPGLSPPGHSLADCNLNVDHVAERAGMNQLVVRGTVDIVRQRSDIPITHRLG